MRQQRFLPWMMGTTIFIAVVGLSIYVSYTTLYPRYLNRQGYPTEAQLDEFFAFAEKAGYTPQNQIAFNERKCSGIPTTCGMILIFEIDQPMMDILSKQDGQLAIVKSIPGDCRHFFPLLFQLGNSYLVERVSYWRLFHVVRLEQNF